jgi:AbrB family looped-hinge helix DNA binding protein
MSETKTSIRKISRGFQVTIPQEFREDFGLQIGDMVEFEKNEDGLKIRPIELISRKETIKSLKKVFSDQQKNEFSSLSEDEIMEIVNKEITQHRKEKRTQTKNDPTI